MEILNYLTKENISSYYLLGLFAFFIVFMFNNFINPVINKTKFTFLKQQFSFMFVIKLIGLSLFIIFALSVWPLFAPAILFYMLIPQDNTPVDL